MVNVVVTKIYFCVAATGSTCFLWFLDQNASKVSYCVLKKY